MFKRLDPRDINITPFKVYKQFTVTNLDSGSGVYGFRAISGSGYNFTKEDPEGGVTNFDLGSSSNRFQNIYTGDLDLSNEAKGGNDVDGTWGSYTIQEGESDLFLINKRSGKKFKFMLQEVS